MHNIFKIGLFVFFLFLFTNSSFARQRIWSTLKESNNQSEFKYVPLNMVTKEVLTFYDQYKYYFDLSGYSKKRFIKENNFGFEEFNWLNDIKELTVFALKSNLGSGSFIMILCVNNENVNLILFSNDMGLRRNAQFTSKYERNNFSKWFNTLLE